MEKTKNHSFGRHTGGQNIPMGGELSSSGTGSGSKSESATADAKSAEKEDCCKNCGSKKPCKCGMKEEKSEGESC